VTDDRDRDEAPVGKVTDGRRLAKLAEAEGPERPSASGSNESGMNEPTAAASDELAEARAKADEYLQHLQRLQAEFDNYRKRVLREQTSTLELAAEPAPRGARRVRARVAARA
jgi:molecular chaperone GrpE (heat shock protein)